MSDEEKRIAIAEACGWTFVAMHGSKTLGFWYFKISAKGVSLAEEGKLKGATPSYELPNYPNDLNAMAEAESALKGDKHDEHSEVNGYAEELVIVCYQDQVNLGEITDIWNIDLIRASARQRSEAFLRVKGLWKEAEGV